MKNSRIFKIAILFVMLVSAALLIRSSNFSESNKIEIAEQKAIPSHAFKRTLASQEKVKSVNLKAISPIKRMTHVDLQSFATMKVEKNKINPLDRIRSESKILKQVNLVNAQTGQRSSKSLLQSQLKYPLLALEEKWQGQGPDSQLISQEAYVADHILVQAMPGTDALIIENFASQWSATVKKKVFSPDLYIVQFSISQTASPDEKVNQMISVFASQPFVRFAEKNVVIYQ